MVVSLIPFWKNDTFVVSKMTHNLMEHFRVSFVYTCAIVPNRARFMISIKVVYAVSLPTALHSQNVILRDTKKVILNMTVVEP